MYKAMAVIRTVFLIFIIGYTLLSAPFEIWGDATVAVGIGAMRRLNRAAWIAVAWIALETLVGWIVVALRNRSKEPPAKEPAATEPPASLPSV